MSAKIVKELLTRWSYKVDTKQLATASRMIKSLKKEQEGMKKSSTAFQRGEVANVKLMTRAWSGLNKQVKTYGKKTAAKAAGKGGGGAGGFFGGGGQSGSLPFLIGRLAGSNALTSAMFAGPKVVAGLGILKSIQLASNREETAGKFQALLGGKGKGQQAENLIETLNQFGKKTPFGIQQLRGLAETLLASGFAADDLVPKLRMIGSFVGADSEKLNRVLFNFAEIRSKTFADKVDLKQFTRAGVPIIRALQKQTGKMGLEWDRFVSKRLVSFEMIEKAMLKMSGPGGPFHGMLEVMNLSTKGKVSELGDELVLFGEAFGKLLTPLTKKLLDEAINLMGVLNEALGLFVNLWNGFHVSQGLILLVDLLKDFAIVGAGLFLIFNPLVALFGLIALILEDFFVFMSGGDSLLGRLINYDWGLMFDGMWIAFKEQMTMIGETIESVPWIKAAIGVIGGSAGSGGESDLMDRTDTTSLDPSFGIRNQSMEFNQINTINGGNQPASEMIASLGTDGFRLMNQKAQPAFAV
jgi:large-conductance mechanosensitive channel